MSQERVALKGGPEAMASRVLEKVRTDVEAQVQAGLKTVDEAMASMKEWQAEVDDWREKTEREAKKLQMPGSAQGYNFGRVYQAVLAGGTKQEFERYAPHEWAISEEYAQATGPDSSGGFIVPGEARSELIELVRPLSVALALGAVETPFSLSPVEIPREQGTPLTPTPKAENTTLDSQDAEFGQLRMNPKLVGLLVKGSRRFFAMGAQADPFIRRILVREMKVKIDTYALTGTGASEQPIGVFNATGVSSVDFLPTTATQASDNNYRVYEKLVEMQNAPLEQGNHESLVSPGWAIASKAKRAFQTIKSEDSTAAHGEVSRKVLTEAQIDRILGDRFRATGLLSSGTDTQLIYGDWAELVIGMWGGMQIESTETGGDAFAAHQRWLKATVEMDIGVWHPTAFAVSTNYDTTGIV